MDDDAVKPSQFGVGINLKPMILWQWMSINGTQIMKFTKPERRYTVNETIESDFSDNLEVGTAGLYKKYTRFTVLSVTYA